MKIVTILGTRPEIIRLSRVIPLLDQNCEHILVHTGQNYDPRLNDIFFTELNLRSPDHVLQCRAGSPMAQVGSILTECEKVLSRERPDRLLILGDTNSALSAMVAKRLGIPVFHMEAGNRCFDDRVPEEVNRRVVDHCSNILLPYTERSRANLLREGIPSYRIYVTGNPILEVLNYYADKINASMTLQELGIEARRYFLVTLHRAENVDNAVRLEKFITALRLLNTEFGVPVICSLHPRTRSQLHKNGIIMEGGEVRLIEPLGLFDFVNLEKQAFCVLSDSGTVQEECCLFNIPNVTLRDVTERPETLEAGSTILSGCEPKSILSAVRMVTVAEKKWQAPAEYLKLNVAATVMNIVLGLHLT